MSIEERFFGEFPYKPSMVISVPGRTELCGNHTDHQSGKVIAAAIDKKITAAVSARKDSICSLHTDMGSFTLDISDLDKKSDEAGTSAALVRGCARYLSEKALNIGGFDAVTESQIPIGGGLSSSAAFEVLICRVFSRLYNADSISPYTIAAASQYAESSYFGKPCGMMDQAACAFGGVLLMDFDKSESPEFIELKWPFKDRFSIYVINTGSSHANMTWAYAEITSDMLAVSKLLGADRLRHADEDCFMSKMDYLKSAVGERAVMRAEHFYDEERRVDKMAEAIKNADAAAYADIMRQSAHSSETLLKNIFTPDQKDRSLEKGIAHAREYLDPIGGVARVHGGGFAGSMQALVPAGADEGFVKHMESMFGSGSAIKVL